VWLRELAVVCFGVVRSCSLVDQIERRLLTLLLKELGKVSAESIENYSFDKRDLKLLRLPACSAVCASWS
jgi:hypothetical protein